MRPWVVVCALLLIVPACASRADSVQEQARSIEGQLWSPYCPGRLLIDCTTRQARELRSEIAERLRRGESRQDVLEWVRRNHGDEVLARPQARGAGLVLWLVPGAIFAIGALVVARLLRRRRPGVDAARPVS